MVLSFDRQNDLYSYIGQILGHPFSLEILNCPIWVSELEDSGFTDDDFFITHEFAFS